MDAFDSLREAGTVDDPAPQVFERAEQILLDYIASVGSPTTPGEVGHRRLRVLSEWSPPYRWLSAAAVFVVAGAVALAVINPWGSSSGFGGAGPSAQVLSLSSVRLMVDATVAALNSGTAHMNITQSAGGSPVNQFSVDVTFSGDEPGRGGDVLVVSAIESNGPPSSPSTSSSDLRFVERKRLPPTRRPVVRRDRAQCQHVPHLPQSSEFRESHQPVGGPGFARTSQYRRRRTDAPPSQESRRAREPGRRRDGERHRHGFRCLGRQQGRRATNDDDRHLPERCLHVRDHASDGPVALHLHRRHRHDGNRILQRRRTRDCHCPS